MELSDSTSSISIRVPVTSRLADPYSVQNIKIPTFTNYLMKQRENFITISLVIRDLIIR